jgi:hypothetical protein
MGRGLDCEVVVSDRGVSRNHAVLVRSEAGYHLRDLSSTNGTFLNDERIDDRDHLLRDSDTIGFGQGDVSYVYHSPTAETIRLTLEPTTDVLPVTAAETIAQVGQADEPHAQDERGQTSMDDEIYEGTVRLKVQAEGSVGLMVGFVQRLGDNPDCRVLRLLGDARGGVEAWLKLRTPVSLREWLGAMDGVVHVSPTEGRDLSPQSGDTPLTVRLKTEDVDSSAERTPCVNCRELLEPNVTVCRSCGKPQL